MSERTSRDNGCLGFVGRVLLVSIVGNALGTAWWCATRIGELRADVQEIRKHLNIPAEPEKEEAK